MIEAVTLPIKALGLAIQTASDTIAGKNPAAPGGMDMMDPEKMKGYATERNQLQAQLADIQSRASINTADQKFAQYNASMMDESSGATGSFNKKQAEEMEAQRQEQLAQEAEAAQARLDEINRIMPANEQSEQSGFDMTVDILVKVYKALTDQTDTLERAIKQID
jgi:uncharacterized protein involved in copper resistance